MQVNSFHNFLYRKLEYIPNISNVATTRNKVWKHKSQVHGSLILKGLQFCHYRIAFHYRLYPNACKVKVFSQVPQSGMKCAYLWSNQHRGKP